MRRYNDSVLMFPIMIILFIMIMGWGLNIVKICNLDFESPYKAEVIRLIGIPMWPVGAIIGYIDIKDGRE